MGDTIVKIEIKADGKIIPLNKFVQKIISNIIIGIINSLKDVKDWKEVTFTIKRE